jgi:uncharacterized membrane protein
MQDTGVAFSILMGINLAGCAGLRAFLPPLGLSLLAWSGHVTLAPTFAWLGRPEVAGVFAVAAIVEIIADKYPGLDHLLDAVGLIVRPLAGALAASSLLTGMDPLLALCVGIITGSAAAGTVHAAKAKLRLLSSGLTAGIGNPVLSCVEDGTAIAGTVLGIVAPLLIGLLAVGVVAWLVAKLLQHGGAARTNGS